MLDDPERQLLPLGRFFSQPRSPSRRAGRPLPQSPPEQTSLAQPVFLPSSGICPLGLVNQLVTLGDSRKAAGESGPQGSRRLVDLGKPHRPTRIWYKLQMHLDAA